jgi:hypothetical protein
MDTTARRQLRLFGYLGLAASLLVGLGECLVHLNPAAPEGGLPYSYFLGISRDTLTMGNYLIVPFIALYIFGYYHLYLALKPGGRRLAGAVLTLGIFAFVIGGVWVSSRAHFGSSFDLLDEAGNAGLREGIVASYEKHVEVWVQVLRVLVLAISVCFVWAILRGGTLYPKWMAFFNPITLLLLVFFLFFCVPAIGKYLAPTAMNVAHLTLFSASLIALKKA